MGNLDSLLDTMTNVVGVLIVVLIVTQVNVSSAAKRIRANLPEVTVPMMTELREKDEKVRKRLPELEDALWPFTDPGGPENLRDEFESSGIESVDDIRAVFSKNFFFGCEADDPSNASAFDTRRNPGGLRLNAIFSSDIGHWDVPDNREVLAEAYELVERGLFSADDFRAFTFGNAVDLYSGACADFFEGTTLSQAAARHNDEAS